MQDASSYYAKDRAAWREWLAAHHQTEQSVWLIYDKGAARRLSYDAIVEEALCFGWVDSKPAKLSDTQSKLYISKRKPKSVWAKTNKARIAALESQGLMQPAGLEVVRIAKENGSWETLDRSDNLEAPVELVEQLVANPKAKDFYESMSASSKRIILEWIYSTKREETKRARVNETVQLALQGIKAHHYRQ